MMTCCALYKILITNTNWTKTQNGRRYKSLQIVFSEEVAIYIYTIRAAKRIGGAQDKYKKRGP